MLTLILSKDWISGRDEILSRIASDVADQKPGRILMVPELISHDTERRLCKRAGDTASRFAEVLSFPRLAARVSDRMGNGAMECLDNGGRIVTMAAVARQLHSKLKAYAAVESKPEFLAELVDAVDEFKRCCITPRDLGDAAARTEGTLAQKLEELSLILEAYDAICAQGKRDPRDQMTWLLEQLEDSTFGQEHVFYIDGFPDFTRQHLAILEHLICTSPQVTVCLNCDRVDSELMAFEKAGNTAAQLVRCAKNAGIPLEIQILEGQNSMTELCGGLFQGKIPDCREKLRVVQANSLQEEVYAAADHVEQLVRSGSRYRDIAIVCGDMNAYESMMRLVFRRCGIPLYQSGTEDILQKTVISTVLVAMDAALGGFEQHGVLRYLKSAFVPVDTDTADKLENYIITWGIRGNGFLKPWAMHPEGLSGVWTDGDRAKLEGLNEARLMALEPLFHLRQGFLDAENMQAQIRALHGFLAEIHLAERLGQLAEEMDALGEHRDAQILNQLWEILLGAMDQLYDALGQTVWEPELFTRLFTLLLSQYDVGTIPPVLDAVTVGPVSAMRCQQEKHLLVLGAAEGAMPGYGGSKGLLTDQERVTLREMGVPLTGGAVEGLQAEFAEIYGVFAGATESVYVSCPSGSGSYVYNRLAKMAGGMELCSNPMGPAGRDHREAGAYLAGIRAEDAARDLGVLSWYQDAKNRAEYDIGNVSPEHVRSLYGDRLHLSASQVDRQAECRMSYFLKYGLGAKERKETTVDPAEFGTYVHDVLEHTAREVMEKGGFEAVSLEETLEIARKYSDDYAAQRFAQLDSQRTEYLFRRNWHELELVVQELWQELKDSSFRPEDFELQFGEGGAMPAIDIEKGAMRAVLRGFVDRVDIWKKDGMHYFRVVDYKTGRKDFDYCDVFNGVGLQMLLYLFALERQGSQVVGGHPIAAGVQYFPARVPLVSADGRLTDQEAEKLRQKEWKRKGLILGEQDVLEAMEPGGEMRRLSCTRKKDGSISGDLADREQLQMLEEYVFHILGEMVTQIASGDIRPNPYTRGTSHNACTYCPYGSICHKGQVPGRRNYKTMTAQRFWEEVEREVRPHG